MSIKKKSVSILSVLLLLFSMMTPMFAGATPSGDISESLREQNLSPESKINDRLLDIFEEDEKVTFLIKFEEKADVMSVAQDARAKAKEKKLSGYQQEFEQRSAVINELKSIALESQHNVKKYLEKEVEKGNAEGMHSYHIVNGMAVAATKEVAQKLASFPEVEKILPDETRHLITPDDTTDESDQHPAADDAVEWNIDRVEAPSVWSMGIDGSGTVVATIDSGAQWDHPALKEQYRGYNPATDEVDHEYSFYDATGERDYAYDSTSHGTHVMGTMVGAEADGSNQIGVAPGAEWIAAKVFDTAGRTTDARLLDAGEWMLAPGGDASKAPDVINNSWGGGPGIDEWYQDMVKAWRAAEIFPAFAAGNITTSNPGGPESVATPANYEESFAVGATDSNDMLADFSLRGPSPYGEIKPEMSAPGVSIRSAVPGNGYELKNGTSMATPAVAATVALLRSVDSNLTVDEMEEILINNAIPKTDEEYSEVPNNGYGYGILDAYQAVLSVTDGLGLIAGTVVREGEDTVPPTYEHTQPEDIFHEMDLDLTIVASDNIAVTSVELNYELSNGEWENIEATQVSGDHLSGEYFVTIPKEDVDPGILTYKWTINDYGENQVTTEEYQIEAMEGIGIGFFDDFENEPVYWQKLNEDNEWEWGEPTSGPEEAYSGDNVFATNLDGNYGNYMDSTLLMPPVDMPEEGDTFLEFMSWHHFEVAGTGVPFDFGYVIISTDIDKDVEDWTELQVFEGLEDEWNQVTIDLSDYLGERVYIGFRATSDVLFTEDGWYIDDVALTDGSEELAQIPLKQNISILTEEEFNNVKEDQVPTIPLEAYVSVLETGRSSATNPYDGSYSIIHGAGEFTVKAETYGYASEEKSVTIEEDGNTEVNFVLEKLEEGTITGQITAEDDGVPVEDATVLLIEDANIDPVLTDGDGNFSLTAYEGSYTLRVIANGYYSKEVEVVLDGMTELNIELEAFYPIPGDEIAYDDGTAENARAYYDAGNGYAVRMSLEVGEDTALVTHGVFQFHDEEFPEPGGTEFIIEVWDALGEDGLPGERIAGPIEAEAIRDLNEWTVVELSEHNIQVFDDFYMVYIQPDINTNSPGLAIDEDGPNSERNYRYVGGDWEEAPESEGNYMIRSRISYGVESPVIDPHLDDMITNETEISIVGTAEAGTSIKLFNNEEEVGTADVDPDGNFEVDATLTEGENLFTAITIVDQQETTQSKSVKVVLDTVAPEVIVQSPEEGERVGRDSVTFTGEVSDTNFDYLTIDNQLVDVKEDGTYSHRVGLIEGENQITLEAYDLAGNMKRNVVTVSSVLEAPVIEDVQPSTDLNVNPGDVVEISFISETINGEAYFNINLPNQQASEMSSGHEMEEVEPGVYEGTWSVPTNTDLEGAVIEVSLTDDFGKTAVETAGGKLYISSEQIDRIEGDDRYDTAIEISREGWSESDTVILARGDDFADALAGVPLAHKLDVPILLTLQDRLSRNGMAEIQRLGAENVIVLGGDVAIEEGVIDELESAGLNVRRIAGDARFGTAALIAEEVSPDGASEVAVANGMDFPDALSVASHAAKEGMPILLTMADRLPVDTEAALSDLGVSESIVVGEELVVADEVVAQLPNPLRLGGDDRYETNIALAEHFGVESNHLFVATGHMYADALTGAVLAAQNGSAIVLVHHAVPASVENYINNNDVVRLSIFGGDVAVDLEIEHDLERLLP